MPESEEKKQETSEYPQVNRILYACAFVLDVLIVLSVFDQPIRRWATLGVCVFLWIWNATIIPRLYRKQQITNNSFMLRELVNGFGQAAKVVAAAASLPTWGWLFMLAAIMDTQAHVWAKRTLWGLLGVEIGVSIYVGIPPLQIVTLSALAMASMKLNDERSKELMAALRELERKRAKLERQSEELRQMQTLATQQEKMSSLGMLAAGIAHEINNPMAFITSNISQLEADLPRLCQSEALRKEYEQEIIPEIKEGTLRVNTIVDDLRRFARGDVESRTMFDVNEVVRSAVRMTQGRAAPGVAVSLSLNDIPPQSGFPRQLSQVVINLLMNAVQAVAEGGTVHLETNCDAHFWRLIVADNGPGMDKETQTKIFDPFFTTKPLGEGTGLGLAVVHGIVEQQKGRIEVKSSLREGTCFTLTLPLRPADRLPKITE